MKKKVEIGESSSSRLVSCFIWSLIDTGRYREIGGRHAN